LDTRVDKPDFDCLQVSAGHDKHEYTSGYAIKSVFDFLVKRTQLFLAGEDPNDKKYDHMPSSDSEESATDDTLSREETKPSVTALHDKEAVAGTDK